MNFKRIGRSLMCLLLVCCLLFNAFPQKADATAAGAAGVITGAATVSVSAPMVIGATLIALGLYAGVNGTDGIEAVVDSAVTHLQSAGQYVVDGAVELLRTVDSAGIASYYVDGGIMESLRSWLYDSDYISASSMSVPLQSGEFLNMGDSNCPGFGSDGNGFGLKWYHGNWNSDGTYSCCLHWALISTTYFREVYSYDQEGNITSTSTSNPDSLVENGIIYYFKGNTSHNSAILVNKSSAYFQGAYETDITNLNAIVRAAVSNTINTYSFGYLPSSDTTLDDTTVVTFHPYLADVLETRQSGGSGGSGDDGNNNKWWLRLALGASAAAVFATTQQQQIENPSTDIQEVTWGVQFDVTDYTTEDQKKIVYISPQTGSNPGTGGESGGESGDSSGDVGSGSDDETKWFQRIVTGIEELPSKFGSWFTDLKTNIEEIPSKFSTWFEKIITWLETIWETLCEIPSTLANLFENLLSKLFAPAPDFIANKVEALKAKYPYLDTFLGLGTNLKGFFMNLGAKPPIIYIDLGSATGSYLFGGKTVFVDLTWYSQYKALMDSIIGAFIWLWLAWRVFLSIPGIIQGEAGTWGQKQNDIGMGTTAPPIIFTQKELPSGRHSRGSKE